LLFGHEIIKPNESPRVLYVNGPRAFGLAGVVMIQKSNTMAPRIINLQFWFKAAGIMSGVGASRPVDVRATGRV